MKTSTIVWVGLGLLLLRKPSLVAMPALTVRTPVGSPDVIPGLVSSGVGAGVPAGVPKVLNANDPVFPVLKVLPDLSALHNLAFNDSLFTSDTESVGPDDFLKERATLGF